MRAIHHSSHQIDKNDRDAIRDCRRQAIEASHEKLKRDDIFKRPERNHHHPDL